MDRTPGAQAETYLDNAATTRPYPEVVDAVAEALAENWGNPSSVHHKGKDAKAVLEQSRARIADALGVEPPEVYFTSGGTEANNLAISGACLAHGRTLDRACGHACGPLHGPACGPPHGLAAGALVTSTLEHPSVTKTVRGLKRTGWDVGYVDMRDGHLDLEQLRGLLDGRTALVTMMRVHNELGWLYPTEKVARLRDEHAPQALLHVDAVQAFGKLDFRPKELGAQMASISAHKIGGPKGVGALYVEAGTPLFTTAFGGGQERGLRSGTEPLPLIAGFAKAVELTMSQREQTHAHVTALKAYLLERLSGRFPQLRVNSLPSGSPYIVNFTLPGIQNEQALRLLDSHDVFVSAAAACTSNHTTVPAGTWRRKHPLVLELAGVPPPLHRSTFRVGLWHSNSKADIDLLVELLSSETPDESPGG
ncbi:MAG: cysteine desulfurase [Coriobacteriales bacterium]|nr:cysteine desulfurase [Coriobacteriales bacterium]